MNRMRKISIVIAVCAAFLAALYCKTDIVYAEDWKTLKSDYFTVYYRPGADLKKISGRLSGRSFFIGGKRDPDSIGTPAEKVARRLDILLRRAEDILGMYPRNLNIKIKIFKTQDELDDEHDKIFGKKERYKSFYVYKHDTIYTTERNMSDSIISHEMGHAIVDHYFVVRPPEKVREILASYVDVHLED